MPLIKSPSKKAVGKNIEIEMKHGKPQKQSIAIALSVQRQAKKKKAHETSKKREANIGEKDSLFAYGGNVSLAESKKPMPKTNEISHSMKAESDNRPHIKPGARDMYMRPSKDEIMSGHFAHGGDVMCAHGGPMHCMEGCYADGGPVPMPSPSPEPIDPDSEEGKGLKSIRNALGNPMSRGGYVDESRPMPSEEDNDSMEISRNRRAKARFNDTVDEHTSVEYDNDLEGHDVSDMDEHQVNPHDGKAYHSAIGRDRNGPARQTMDDYERNPVDGKDYHQNMEMDDKADRSKGKVHGRLMHSKGMQMAGHYAEGGEIMGKPKSLAEEVMARRKNNKMLEEGDEQGTIDLERHNEEYPNRYDEEDMDAARRNQYDDSQLSEQPEDSNEHGHELPDEDEHYMDMVEAVRRRIKAKRGA